VGDTTVSLRTGWNAVGLQCQQVTSLSASSQVAGLATFEEGGYRTAPVTPAEVNRGAGGRRGFWVFAFSEANLTYAGGDDGRGQAVPLQPGWNLISLATPDAVPGSALVVRRGSQVVPLASVLLPTFYQLATDGAATPVDVTAGGTLSPGHALWVFANAAAELSWPAAGATGLEVTPSELTLTRLGTRQLTATARLADGSTRDVTREVAWTSSVPSGAAVSSTGLVTALYPGTAEITAALGELQARSLVTTTDAGVPPVPVLRATATSLSASPNASVFGESVTFTASVTDPAGGVPSGTVSFFDGSTNLGAGTLSAGVATLTTSTLTVGSRTITASYGGNSIYAGSSGALAFSVGAAGTTTTLESSLNPSTSGAEVTFTANVTVNAPGSGTPTGNVTFKDGTTTLAANVPLTGGEATFSTASLSTAAHSLTVEYFPDPGFSASTSTALAQTVNPAVFTTPSPRDFTVPAGITQLTVVVEGAQGGAGRGSVTSTGGLGGSVTANLTVTPGEVLRLVVGGQGQRGVSNGVGIAGFNGGGDRTVRLPGHLGRRRRWGLRRAPGRHRAGQPRRRGRRRRGGRHG